MKLHAIASTIALIATALAQSAPSTPLSNNSSTVECFDGLKMFVSRGTSEPPGSGETGKVVEAIAGRINGSSYQANPYPASGDNPNYFMSVANGTAGLKKMVGEYAEACPGGRMALFGYSQGAQVTSNILCGMPAVWALYGGVDPTELEKLQAFSSPLPRNITRNVVAVVLFGDTTHRSVSTYNRGDSTGSGIFWRADPDVCESYGDRIRSYCTAGDPFCDVGPDLNATAHLTYVADYGGEVVEYVVGQYENGGEEGIESGAVAGEEAGDSVVAAQESSGTWSWSISGVAVVASLLAFGML